MINIEADAIFHLKSQLTEDFAKSVNVIHNSEGRLIIAGVGKSANIAKKIVATFNSTGQPSIFLHAGDGFHGDLGNIQKEDVVMCISKSGNTVEIKQLVPLVQDLGNQIISICGNENSYLAIESDVFINSRVDKKRYTKAVFRIWSQNFEDRSFFRLRMKSFQSLVLTF